MSRGRRATGGGRRYNAGSVVEEDPWANGEVRMSRLRLRAGLVLAGACATVALAAVGVTAPRPKLIAQVARGPAANAAEAPGPGRGAPTVQQALLLPYDFPFDKPTPLNEVARHLSATLHAPVVIDRAALDRQQLKDDDEVQLRLEGVRLKTGLKLLLDQLDMTYHVVPEDNLLVLTDTTGSSDPIDAVSAQLKSLHRDLHDLRDAVDDIRAAMGLDEGGARMRKPTIIEEVVPEKGKGKAEGARPAEPPAAAPSPSRSRPGA
jgi:hypothetical protein